ncbi:MAG: hypothetical protein FJ137_15825 [Deltaproteobacteria bacterium]|nr:hypothetical protein [Deltaproteobacteria bacterium]
MSLTCRLLLATVATCSLAARADDPAGRESLSSSAVPPSLPTGSEDTGSPSAPAAPPALDPALQAAIEDMVERRLEAKLTEKKAMGFFDDAKVPVSLSWRGDFFTKFLVRNNQSGGCVSYGNPSPEGDNFSGDNGVCSELGLTVLGRVSDRVEAGARIQSRFGAQWADWYENGDERDVGDGSGESLGQNHAAYLQLRGVFLRVAPPIPTVRSIHVGASDLSMFNAWTIGKSRYIERDNGRGLFVDGSFGDALSYTLARVALPKLFAGPGYTTGIADPVVQNPFWERDAAWAYKLKSQWEWFTVEQVTSYVLDEEADLDDPDALGSTNAVDARDGAVTTNARYQNANATVELTSNYVDWLGIKAIAGYSYSKTDDRLVFNSVSGAQGFTPVPMGEHHGAMTVIRTDLIDPLDLDLDLQFEYFNIGRDWVSVFGARRETDLLLTDGFVDGQVATLNVANEFQDFTDPFYEPIIGWHGGTALLTWRPGALELAAEGTLIDYNTDTGEGALDVDKTYPDFLYTDGMTDTELFSFANTNDRGRDPRSVYHRNQNRRTFLAMARGAYTFDFWKGVTVRAKHKTIIDNDLRDPRIRGDDDYAGVLLFNKVSVEAPVTDELSAAVGAQFDHWTEARRSGEVVAGVADYPDYVTTRAKGFADVRYSFGGLSLWYHLEVLNKDLDATDDRLDQRNLTVIRSLAMVSAAF